MAIHRDPAHRRRLVRRVICVRGEMPFELECEPRFDYARAEHETIITELRRGLPRRPTWR